MNQNNFDDPMPKTPEWFIRLAKGKRVFGSHKDKLVLEIFELGGAFLLEAQCGLRCKDEMIESLPALRLSALQDIKRKLVNERTVALKALGDVFGKKGRVEFSHGMVAGWVNVEE